MTEDLTEASFNTDSKLANRTAEVQRTQRGQGRNQKCISNLKLEISKAGAEARNQRDDGWAPRTLLTNKKLFATQRRGPTKLTLPGFHNVQTGSWLADAEHRYATSEFVSNPCLRISALV
jgi:hypothetical protein